MTTLEVSGEVDITSWKQGRYLPEETAWPAKTDRCDM